MTYIEMGKNDKQRRRVRETGQAEERGEGLGNEKQRKEYVIKR